MQSSKFIIQSSTKGVVLIVGLIIVIAVLVLGGGAVYFSQSVKPGREVKEEPSFSQTSTMGVVQQKGSPSESITPTTADELTDWQEYLNDRYHYKVKYPENWYFIKEGYSPPPPTVVVFSSLNDPYPPVSAERLSMEISVDQSLGRTLDNYEEIISLKSQYYQETRLTVGGEPAVKIAVPDPNSSEPISIYVQHKNYIYRLVWADNTPEFVQDRKLLDKILQTFSFTD